MSAIDDLSREALLALLDQLVTPTLFGRPDGTILYANAAAQQLLRYTGEQLCAMNRRQLLDDQDPRVARGLAARAATGYSDAEVEFRRGDGTYLNALVSSRIFAGPDGTPWSSVTIRDNTEARQREDQLVAHIEQLAAAINQFPSVLPRLMQRGAILDDGTAGSRRQSGAATVATAGPAESMLFDQSPDATLFSHPDGRIIAANAAAARLLGYSKNELHRLHRDDLIDAQDPRAQAAFAECHQNRFAQGEIEFRHKDGSRFLAQFRCAGFTGPEGSDWICISFRDITEQRRLQSELQASAARYARVLDGSNQGFWEWDLNSGEFTVSDRFESMLGFAPGERSLAPELWPRYVHPDDLPAVKASIDRHLKGQSPAHDIEMRCLTRDGQWRWIQTQGRIVGRNADGSPALMSGTHTDISRRKEAEAESRRNEARFHAVIDGLPIPCALNDDDGNITFLNDAFVRCFGYTRDDLPTVADWWPHAYPDPEYRQSIENEWAERLAAVRAGTADQLAMETRVRCKNGATRYVKVSATAIGEAFGTTHIVMLHELPPPGEA